MTVLGAMFITTGIYFAVYALLEWTDKVERELDS
jgi:hypothetical protein